LTALQFRPSETVMRRGSSQHYDVLLLNFEVREVHKDRSMKIINPLSEMFTILSVYCW
jgi:hypothetical protein